MTSLSTRTVPGLDHTPGTRLVFGVGAIAQLGQLAHELGGTRVLLVSDPGVTAAGHTDTAEAALRDAGLGVARFAGAHENPTTEDVAACVAVAQDTGPDLIVAVGGGSALDTAKGANFIHTNGGAMADYWGVGKATAPMLPFIAVPTTHGTGSETQSFALVADAESHRKMACGDPKALPKIALLDPALTLTQPTRVAACTSIDAITHAAESYVCTKRNAVSMAYALEAFRLTLPALRTVVDRPDDLDARGDLLLGAAYAGLAIENSMLGAAHACANPLTARFGITHGHAVGLMLPHVVALNTQDAETRVLYGELAAAVGLASVDALLAALAENLTLTGLPANPLDAGGVADAIPELAADAATQWTGTFNPTPMDEAAYAALYERAFAAPRL